jgi:hypothetical protein
LRKELNMEQLNTKEIADIISQKGNLKDHIYNQTLDVLKLFKSTAQEIIEELQKEMNTDNSIILNYKDRGDFEFEIKFAGDILIFMMHSNVFEFSKYHDIMNIPYVKKHPYNSYCGVINIYNFLADSFKYNRVNDLGYMIGRVFINREKHYFIEGKREIAMIYNDFSKSLINKDSIRQILLASILYTINFDLLTPPYEEVKIVSVDEIQTNIDNMKMKTAKRLGFTFRADDQNDR